jgi:hypothetical protein
VVKAMSDQLGPPSGEPALSPDKLAAARFEFDKQVEERQGQLEERKLRQARFDSWSRVVGTVIVGLLVTGGLQWYSIRSDYEAKTRADVAQKAQKEREESAQQAQVAIQLANAREKALSDLRAQMFNALLQNYFKKTTDQERIAILELIGLNFRDAVQIKPMFEVLDAEFRARAATSANLELRGALRRAARVIIRDQLNQIRQAKDGIVCRMKLKVGQTASPDCFPPLTIKVRKVDPFSVEVRTNSSDGTLVKTADLEAIGEDFVVTYFDMPMVDYKAVLSSSSARWRYSLVLDSVAAKEQAADIAVALLPVSAVDAQHRYAFDELLEKYLRPADRP